MLSNAYLLAKIGADTDENEQRFARWSIAPRTDNWKGGGGLRARRADAPVGDAAPRRAPEAGTRGILLPISFPDSPKNSASSQEI